MKKIFEYLIKRDSQASHPNESKNFMKKHYVVGLFFGFLVAATYLYNFESLESKNSQIMKEEEKRMRKEGEMIFKRKYS